MTKKAIVFTLLTSIMMLLFLGCTSQVSTQTQINASSYTLTPSVTVTIAPTVNATLTPIAKRPGIPAPVVPEVSALISVENVSRLTRLTSLGEGDLLNFIISPDGKLIVFSTSNGVLVLDASSLVKVLFLPTAMKPLEVSFIEAGDKLTARDCDQGYVWSMPDGEEISHVFFFSHITEYPYMWECRSIPDANWENGFVLSVDTQKTGLYDLKNGQARYTLDFDDAQHAVFSPDNQFLVLHTPTRLVIVQNSNGKIIQELEEPGIKWLFFTPDGKTLAAVIDNQTKFWNFSDFQYIGTANGTGTGFIYTYPFYSPDSSILVFRNENTFRLLRARDNAYINTYSGYGLKFTTDSQGFLVDSGVGRVNYYSLNDDRSEVELKESFAGTGPGARIDTSTESVPGVFSSDFTKLLLAETTGEGYSEFLTGILVYNISTNSVTNVEVDMYRASLLNAVWLQDQQTFGLIIKSDDFLTFYTLDLNSQKLIKVIGGRDWSNPFIGVNFSPTSDLLIFTHGSRYISWDIKNNSYDIFPETQIDQGHFTLDTKINFSPDLKRVQISDSANLTYVFDSQDYAYLGPEPFSVFYVGNEYTGIINGNEVAIHDDQTNANVNSFSISTKNYDYDPINNLLASVSEEGLSVWDLSDPKNEELLYSQEISVIDTNGTPWYDGLVKFSPDGNYVAANKYSKDHSKNVTIWDSKEGTLLFEFGPAWNVSFAFSVDSKMIAISKSHTGKNIVSIFDLSSGERLFTTGEYFSEGVQPRIAFSPDGKFLAILPEQGYPQLWGIP